MGEGLKRAIKGAKAIQKKRLSDKDITVCYDTIVEKDFFATMAGWNITAHRITRLFGAHVAKRYIKWRFA